MLELVRFLNNSCQSFVFMITYIFVHSRTRQEDEGTSEAPQQKKKKKAPAKKAPAKKKGTPKKKKIPTKKKQEKNLTAPPPRVVRSLLDWLNQGINN